MGKKDKRVDEYIARSADFAKPILIHLRKLVHQACPEVVETIKWSFPNFDYKGILCSMASFKQHCAFGFWKAALLPDPGKRLSGLGETAMGSFGQIRKRSDLPPDKILLQYIKAAMRLNEEGIKIARKPAAPATKTIKVPEYMKKALSSNKTASMTFEEFSYSNKKEYVDWVTEAKTEATRHKRLDTAIAWMAEGKGRNWKYERKRPK